MVRDNRNLTMLMDLYELTMANGIFKSEYKDTITYFDMFFRRVPDGGGFANSAARYGRSQNGAFDGKAR